LLRIALEPPERHAPMPERCVQARADLTRHVRNRNAAASSLLSLG